MSEHIAAVIRRLRKAKGLTQAAVAQLAGVSRDTIIRMEAGDSEHGYSTVESVVMSLGGNVDDLQAAIKKEQQQTSSAPRIPGTERLLELYAALDGQHRALTILLMESWQDGTRPPPEGPSPAAPKKAPRKR
jgi:transcriptional regulator with XRE-family HTH domain